jgi:hypothetical protein
LFGEAVGAVADGIVGKATVEVVEQCACQRTIATVACEL